MGESQSGNSAGQSSKRKEKIQLYFSYKRIVIKF